MEHPNFFAQGYESSTLGCNFANTFGVGFRSVCGDFGEWKAPERLQQDGTLFAALTESGFQV
jgi:hypothetical protein